MLGTIVGKQREEGKVSVLLLVYSDAPQLQLVRRTRKGSTDFNIDLDNKQISMALGFTRNILTNKFFFPNNLPFPKSRMILENYFN